MLPSTMAKTFASASTGGHAATLGDLPADGKLGLRLAEPPGTVLGSITWPATPGLRGVGDGARCRCVRQ
jgi:hypothetical protein